MQQGKFNIIIGGQAGSEAKGKLSGWLCHKHKPDLLVMTSSPNAGHTVVTAEGKKMVSYHLPIGSVMCDCPIVLGPASLINPYTFVDEIKALGINPYRLYIDKRASLISPHHISGEVDGKNGKKLSDIGSTLQGIGECRTGKMRRDGEHALMADLHAVDRDIHKLFMRWGVNTVDSVSMIHRHLAADKLVICETTQGFDLDLEHGIHPRYCTSKMINPSMAAAEAGVPPSLVGDVYAVIRPYPIRVNNRTGTSGPYAEAKEIDWETVANRCTFPGKPEDMGEITTTTKLPRRVFEFSWERFEKMVRVCGPTSICLQFGNYLDWDCYGAKEFADLPVGVMDFVARLEQKSGVPVEFIGTGPSHDEMVDVENMAGKWTVGAVRDMVGGGLDPIVPPSITPTLLSKAADQLDAAECKSDKGYTVDNPPTYIQGFPDADILAGAEDKRTDPLYDHKIGYIPFAYHLLPVRGLARAAAVMRCGERSGRSANDWCDIPVTEHVNHGLSHIMGYLAGRSDKTHLANAACRVLMALSLDTDEVLPKPVLDPSLGVDSCCGGEMIGGGLDPSGKDPIGKDHS